MSQIEQISIREMRESDLPQTCRLSEQLGYPISLEKIHSRFSALHGSPDHKLFVACDDRDQAIGWIHVGREMPSLIANERADIGALVVDSKWRSRGVGAMLMDAAEKWAASQNLEMVRVRSNVKRSDAHRFYQRRGYQLIKSWHLFTKELNGDANG